jgi:multicomponent Na+:H+ antiporter subunit B
LEHHTILRIVTKLLVPLIMLFALYVHFHADFGPGGGFQAGVIFGAAVIVYGLLFGVVRVKQAAPPAVVRALSACGLLLFAGVGVITLLLGGNYLDYDVLAADPPTAQHIGILLVELGVGVTVAATMIMLFYAFGSRD